MLRVKAIILAWDSPDKMQIAVSKANSVLSAYIWDRL